MRPAVNGFLLTIGLFAIVNCTDKKYDKQKPNDFSFRLYEETDSYNSKTGIYKRKYIDRDSSIKVDLTQDELLLIYDLFKKSDFMSFPKDFECSKKGTFTLPAFSTTIEITYKGLKLEVTNTTCCDKKIEQKKSDKFDNFSSEIRKIINNKQQIKAMRKCDMIFL